MNPFKDKITRATRHLALALLASFVLTSCGGGGGSGQSSASTQAGVEEIPVGGNNASSDSNLVIATFSDNASAQSSASPVQAALVALPPVGLQAGVTVGNQSYVDGAIPWISQYNSTCVGKNGYCGFAAVLMGAHYLSAGQFMGKIAPPPQGLGYSKEIGTWIQSSIDTLFPDIYDCGGPVGISYKDILPLASKLGIEGKRFSEGTDKIKEKNWISNALAKNFPVVARVHSQSSSCGGATIDNRATFYNGGIGDAKVMSPCYYKGQLTSPTQSSSTPTQAGHWVMVTAIDQSSVIVSDPDPGAKVINAGIRRYELDSFLTVLNDNQVTRTPEMYMLCRSGDCPQDSAAFSAPPAVELVANHPYTASIPPTVSSLTSTYSFVATGLPTGLSMDTEGRIVGQTATSGIHKVTVTMSSVTNGIARGASTVIDVVVAATNSLIQSIMQFVTPSNLPKATEGLRYLKSLSVANVANAASLSFVKVGGSLPVGLDLLPNGDIVGNPTTGSMSALSYSFDVEAATSTSKITKTFTLVVDPAPVVAPPAITPVLSAISPSLVTGMDAQQTVVFSGTGFSDGTWVELTDTTHGGIYQKVPVSINPTGTEITIRANFTSIPAAWSARILGPTGLNSAPISFSVVAPVSVAPIVSTVTPSLTAMTAVQTIILNGTDFRPGAVVEVTNLTTGTKASALILTATATQISANYIFDTASMWGIRVINLDGTNSQSFDIQVKAPVTTIAPITPIAVSPGTVTAPGTVLANATASLSWNSVASATYYAVAVRDLNSGVLVVDANTVGASYALNLFSGKQYRWNVAACNSAGCSAYTAPLYFQTPSIGGTPDLVSQSITFPTSTMPGSSITINWTMANLGTAAAATSNSAVRITISSTSSAGTTLASIPTGTIAAGSSVNQSATVTVPSTAGTYYIWIIADNNSALIQSNVANDIVKATSNLTVASTQTPTCTLPQVLQNGVCVTPTPTCTLPQVLTNGVCVTPSTTAPDLQVLSGTVSPSSVSAGGTVSASWMISNQGTGTANASTTVVRINQSTTSAAGSNLASIGTNSLASGGSQSQSANLTAPTTAGTYYVWVIADNSSTAGQSTSAAANDLVRVGSFTVAAAVVVAPAISYVSPNPVTGSNIRQTITINGTGFVNKPTLTLTWTGQPNYTVPTAQVTFVSSTQVQMSITTTTTPDNWTVKVTNPDGSVSNISSFTVR